MKKILILDNKIESVVNFRYHLLKEFIKKGYAVTVIAALNHNKQALELLIQSGIEFIPLQTQSTSLNIFANLKHLLAFYQLIKRERPNIVLNYTIKPVIYGSLMAHFMGIKNIYSNITGLGYVFTEDNLKAKFLKKIISPLYKLALKFNKRVFFQNPSDRELFIRSKFIHKDRSYLIQGSGVDLSYFDVCNLPKAPIFLFMGRLLKHKGIMEYINAARYLKKQYPTIRFMLVGQCDENPSSIKETDLKKWIEEGIVEYLGYLQDVRPALEKCSVFVLPSYREGTPRSVLEAMSMGRPIITTDAPGCRDTVEHSVNGHLVPVRNVEALIQTMEQFIKQPDLINKMGQESRRIAENKYDVHKVNKMILCSMGVE
ncbi:MAG: glycosyltransferase family 4 protein [Gammaproteobacteria bacterium]|nr:glycosyltransferase family 4 protein [Gammaproteobacteria bacterium]